MKACARNNLLCYYTENDLSTWAEIVVSIFFQIRRSKKFAKFYRKTLVLESTFNKFIGFKACNFIKKSPAIASSCETFRKTFFKENTSASRRAR